MTPQSVTGHHLKYHLQLKTKEVGGDSYNKFWTKYSKEG